MSLPQKITSALKDAFSYVLHFESASDVERKPAVVEQLVNASAPKDAEDDYKERLTRALSKVGTRHLDTLLAKNVAVTLDAALGGPLNADNPDITIDGKFTPPGKTGPAGGTLAVLDTPEFPEEASTAIEKFARILKKETPAGALYGLRSTAVAAGEGMVSSVSVVEWLSPESDMSMPKRAREGARLG